MDIKELEEAIKLKIKLEQEAKDKELAEWVVAGIIGLIFFLILSALFN